MTITSGNMFVIIKQWQLKEGWKKCRKEFYFIHLSLRPQVFLLLYMVTWACMTVNVLLTTC